MSELKGKRLLVLGGTAASFDLVRLAKEMGVYTVVTDDRPTGVAKEIADETAMVSTTDIDGLVALVKERNIDGAFCSPSEFNIRNTMQLCQKAGLPFYVNQEQWDRCGNKDRLKQYCANNGLPLIPEYHFESEDQIEECPEDMFPVIVKPVDGASSRGVKVCRSKTELRDAVAGALKFSKAGRVLVEKYMDNGGRLFSFRYILDEGKSYPYMLMDTYIADPVNKKCLVSAFSFVPSEHADLFMETADAKVRNMLREMELKNGTVFAQALPVDGKFYCHDMGYRLSGGMTFRMCEELTGINDMKMMIRYALGCPICTEEDIKKMNPTPKGKVVGQLMIPMNAGTIGKISGVDAIKAEKAVISYIQYYHEGDTVAESAIGTLAQQFARISIVADDKDSLVKIVNRLQDGISVKNTEGAEMYTMRFDTDRLYK